MSEITDSEEVREGGLAAPADDENGDSNGYVHVGPTDVPTEAGGEEVSVFVESVNDSSNQEKHIEQSDGQSASAGDSLQNAPSDIRVTEDGGREDTFVDCPDEISETPLASEEKDNLEETQVMGLGSRLQVHDLKAEIEHLHCLLEKTAAERDSFAQKYEEEKTASMKQFTCLHDQLKGLNEQPTSLSKEDGELVDHHYKPDIGDEELDVINKCYKYLETFSNERSETEGIIKELHGILSMKDQEIESLRMKVNELSASHESSAVQLEKCQHIEGVVNRILTSLASAVNQEEILDESVTGKISHVEKATAFLLENYNLFRSGVDQLRWCLVEVAPDNSMQDEAEIFVSTRDIISEFRRKVVDLDQKLSQAEDENKQLLEQLHKHKAIVENANAEIGNLNAGLQQEKTKLANTKEKLSLAVTKGKALVQQRDSLKQSLADKTSELEKCLSELREKSSALEAAEQSKELLIKNENLTASLQEALTQKDTILQKCGEIISEADVTEELQSVDIIEKVRWLTNEGNTMKGISLEFHRLTDALSSFDFPETVKSNGLDFQIGWLLESFKTAKEEAAKWQDEISRTKEAASNDIDHLTTLLLAETQEKNYLQAELEDLRSKYEGIVGKEYQASMEKDRIVDILLEASGITLDNQEKNYQSLPDVATMVDKCIAKIKDDINSAFDISHIEVGNFENIQILLYTRDMELTLYGQICEEEMLDRVEVASLSNELAVLRNELSVVKDDKDSLWKDLERSEEKAGLLREKLSMAVKKGKGLVQERENLKKMLDERNTEIENLKLELKQKVSTCNDFMDQINKLSADMEHIPKLEADVTAIKEGKNEVEKSLVESNNMLQRVFELIDGIVLPADSVFEEPIEKVQWVAGYLSECQSARIQVEQELRKVKDEASALASKLDEVQMTVKLLQDALSVAESKISELLEEKKELEVSKTYLEQEFQKAIEEASSQTIKYAEVCASQKSLEDTLQMAENKISMLINEKEEALASRDAAEMEIQKVKEEISFHTSKHSDADKIIQSLEDALSHAQQNVSLLAEDNRKAINDKTDLEKEINKLKDEVDSHVLRFTDANSTIKSLEDSLWDAESKMSDLLKEKHNAEEEISALRKAISDKTDLEKEIKKLKDEADSHVVRFTDANSTIRSLEDSLLDAESKISDLLKEKNNTEDEISALRKAISDKTDLENEIKKLKDEVDSHVNRFTDANSTIRSLEDSLLNAESKISDLLNEKNNAEEEISALNLKLNACMQELAGTHGSLENRSMELSGYLSSLRRLMKDGTLASLLQQSFEKKIGSLNDMNILLREIRDHILETDSEMLQNDPLVEDDSSMPTLLSARLDNMLNVEKATGEEIATDGDNIVFHIGKNVEGLHLRDKFLADKVQGISTFMDNLITSLLTKLQATKHGFITMQELIKSLKQKVNDMEMDRQAQKNTVFMLESHIGSLLPACTDATKELESEFQSCLSVLRSNSELGKLNETLSMEFGTVGVEAVVGDQLEHDNKYLKAAEELLSAARQSRNFNIHFRNMVNNMITTIEYLQNELNENKRTSEKVLEERDLSQNKISKLESDLKASENLCMEMRRKLDDYQEKWKTLNEREAELSSMYATSLKKIQDAEDSLLSASQMKSLFDKIIGIEVPLSELEAGDLQLHNSADVRKLFYIIDSYTELVAHDKEQMRSTLERHVHEIEDLKEIVEEHHKEKNNSEKLKSELLGLAIGLEKIIQKLGGEELIEHPNAADVTELLQVLEKLVLSTKMESENFKSEAEELGVRLLGTQKLVDDLSSKVRLLEDSCQSRVASTENVQAKGISASSSSPAQSEISEIQDTGPVGANKSIRSVSPVVHPRTLRKGSSDHLAINIDSESIQLINEETNEDKGHVFKSLSTSGIIPRQGKMIADRVDGIWVSGSRALMNHPRVRLGLIAYWLFVHLWLLGTIL